MSRHIHALATVGMALAGLMSSQSRAAIIPFDAMLNGGNEVPPNTSPAYGVGVFQFDTSTNIFSWTVLYTESLLQGTETAAHIHGPATPSHNAPVLIPLAIGQLKSGSVDITTIPGASAADLQNGLWYVNIHSVAHPGGEIRGQIVPEPATLVFIGSAFLIYLLRPRRSW